MYHREIYDSLSAHLSKKQVTVITGMRRVGKSTAVKYLLSRKEQANHLYLDCERVEVRTMLNKPDYEGIKEELELLGADFSKPCTIAIDEIQLVENLPSLIKYLYDTYGVKFIVTGSSSYYLKNRFSESLAGRKKIFEMYPLNFKEFLTFKDAWQATYDRYQWNPYNEPWYNKVIDLYNEYVEFGGFPEVVLEEKKQDKKDLLRDIINSYIELDVKLLADFTASEELYKLIKLLSARSGNKVDYTKISGLIGINRQKIASYIQLLEQTYLIYQLPPFTKNIDREISQQKKLYFSDTGILNILAEKQLSAGQVFENAVAAQLKQLGSLQFYQKRTGQEIDFIFKGNIAIEIKRTPLEQDLNSLISRANSIDVTQHLLVGHHPPKNEFKAFLWAGSIF